MMCLANEQKCLSAANRYVVKVTIQYNFIILSSAFLDDDNDDDGDGYDNYVRFKST